MYFERKGPKGWLLAPDKLDNHTIEGKGKNKQIERTKRKKGGGNKKAMVAPIVLTFSTLEIGFWKIHNRTLSYYGSWFLAKKCLAEEVYLAD